MNLDEEPLSYFCFRFQQPLEKLIFSFKVMIFKICLTLFLEDSLLRLFASHYGEILHFISYQL